MNEDQTSASLDEAVVEAVENETSRTASLVRDMEADAEKKGIPLKLSGARYRIYETTKPT